MVSREKMLQAAEALRAADEADERREAEMAARVQRITDKVVLRMVKVATFTPFLERHFRKAIEEVLKEEG